MNQHPPKKPITKIISHFVAGYPTYQASLDIALGLIKGGAYALEMQIPFSDPSADGPLIEEACLTSLKSGFTVSKAWSLLHDIRKHTPTTTPIFVMSYAAPVLARTINSFIHQAADAGATGLIVPDLVPGTDEGLYTAAQNANIPAIPVIIPWITTQRLHNILTINPQWIYVALRSGITGNYTELGTTQETFLTTLKTLPNKPSIMAGFGIQHPAQVQTLSPLVDAVVVGSAIIKAINSTQPSNAGIAAETLIKTLSAPV